jgi:hypothetical protein
MLSRKIKNPKIKTKVDRSKSKKHFKILGETLGKKFKIALVPYEIEVYENRLEALEIADFISFCFNHSDEILATIKDSQSLGH